MIKEKNMYKPLPESLTIKQSKVNGLGLFADQPIQQATNLGISHVQIGEEILRTPLGGFINHANEGNVIKVKMYDEVYKTKWNLVTVKDIKKGEEITVRYTFYNI
jgi:hypothetical protein